MVIQKETELFVVKPEGAKTLQQLQRPNTRIPELDGLRGIAVLMVVSFHYINNQLTYTEGYIASTLHKVTSFGWVGVDLFFVLSGFLIGTILIANRDSENYFSTFYVRRLVRIVPNYFLLLLVFWAIWNSKYFGGSYFLTSHQDIPFWSYFAMLHNFFMGAKESMGNDALSITWSIGVEEQFYLIFPMVVFLAKRNWVPWILISFIIVAVIVRLQFSHWIPRYVLLPSRLDGLSIGFLLAFFNSRNLFTTYRSKTVNISLISLVLTFMISAVLYFSFGDLGVWKHTIFGAGFGALLVLSLAASRSFYGTFLRNRTLRWIGVISYSLYLFHYVILGIVHRITGQDRIGIAGLSDIVISCIALMVSVAFSWGVYNLLEKPMVNFGKKFRY